MADLDRTVDQDQHAVIRIIFPLPSVGMGTNGSNDMAERAGHHSYFLLAMRKKKKVGTWKVCVLRGMLGSHFLYLSWLGSLVSHQTRIWGLINTNSHPHRQSLGEGCDERRDYANKFRDAGQMIHFLRGPDNLIWLNLPPNFNMCSEW